MPITIKLPDGRTLSVPDDMTPSEMDAIVAQEMGEPPREGEPSIAADIRAMPDGVGKQQLLHGVEGRVMPIATMGGQASALDRPIRAVGDFIEQRAVPIVRSALKPVWAEVRKRAGVEGQMPSAVANRQAQFIVGHQLRTPEQADALVKSIGQKIDTTLAGSSGPLDTYERVPRYLSQLLKRVERQALPGSDRAAVKATAREVVEDSPLSTDVVTKVEKDVPSAILDASGRPMTRKVVENIKTRALRQDVTPSEGMDIARMTSALSTKRSWGSEAGHVGAKTAEKTIERAVRDAVKHAVPEARPLLQQQGRAMDARTLLDRANWRDANRDQIGMGGMLGVAHGRPLLGALLQLVKENQFRTGLAAGRYGPAIRRNANVSADELQKAILAVLGQRAEP